MARFVVTFTGQTGSGAFSVGGVKTGDKVLNIVSTGGGEPIGTELTSSFASFVVTDAELIQIPSGDLSSVNLAALIERTAVF